MVPVAQAEDPPTAAEMDWRPRAELPVEAARNLPSFCQGGYLQPASVVGAASESGQPGDLPLSASGLSARYEMDSELYLRGDVRIQQGPFAVTGDEARYDQASGRVSIQGPLTSRGDGFLLTGERADYSADTGYLDIRMATFLLHGPEMRGSAAQLARTSDNRVQIGQGQLTTCAPGQNDWSIVASEIELDQAEGVGTAKHVRLQIKDIPVFYWPYASFPIDDRRKSGFLYPAFGSSNAGNGGFLAVPYYFNLAPDYDATLTPQFISGRGLFTEVEGRYLSDFGQSDLQLGYAGNDREYADEVPGEDGERWGLDFTTEARFNRNWTGYGDYSAVSDNDYLSDLNRSLSISQDTHLLRRGGVRYRDDHQMLEAYLSGYQTISDFIADADRPYSQLPNVLYSGETDLGPLTLGLDSQYTFFYRDNDDLTGLDQANGQRLRAIPEIALPLRALWGYVRPSVGVDYTRYELDDYGLGDPRIDRTVPVAEWDSGLYFDRKSSLFDVPYNQTLEPRLYYAWADADADQSMIPDFDTALRPFSFSELFRPNRFSGGDRVGDTNQLTVALTSRFNDLLTGRERARFSLGQVQYFDDREVTLDGEGAADSSDSPLAGEMVLRPVEGLEMRTSGLWEPRTSKTQEGRSQLVFHSEDYRYLASVGHTYRRNEFEQSDIGGVVPVSDRVSLIGRWAFDSELDRTVGSLAGLEYNNCCWSVQLVHQNYLTDEEELQSRVLFQIELKGLGGSGGSSRQISEAIIGFDERERRRFGER
ncbi:LPS-assembly protein LptD [Marinobacter confluentis]|uniref:LPS-assembly protein LptD n=1 Tax=Marinobacter confluentis TaxID=1697557 RepID=A0A4Z1BWD8_9GAMM|nr:LPS-assembly protein LptD [Marinobacter confluentis]TGN38990.1 LPS-assembly protein LptD [Marinobacter confluentis]